jgi:cell division protein ZapA
MSKTISVKVPVAGRVYPLTIKMDEEEALRQAAKEINESIQKLRETYAVRDIQDLLAMTSLEAVTKLKARKTGEEMEQIKQEFINLNIELDKLLD